MTGSWRLPAGVTVFERGWLSSNNVLFASDTHTAIVDTGYVTHASQTLALVRNALGERPLDLIVCTHLHSDHCGGNAILQSAFPSARTLIPPGQAEAVRSWDEEALSYAPTGQRCDRFRFEDVVQPGATIDLGGATWQVHGAPGHDPHSVVLFEPQSHTLISADTLWENGFGVVFPEIEGKHGFDEVGATLDMIDSLGPETVIPGHGSVFGGRARVDAAIANARRRLAALASDPARHATHAVKVLIKFKLLELQLVPEQQLLDWALSTALISAIHDRFFAGKGLREWLQGLVVELAQSGALERRDGVLSNM
jgi:glyoxylase-like metal-dependent hydrolase (beta-lactamase superfamily II)